MKRRRLTQPSGPPTDGVDLEEEKRATPSDAVAVAVAMATQQEDPTIMVSPRKLGLTFILNEPPLLPADIPLWPVLPVVSSAARGESFDLTQQLEQTCSIDGATDVSPPSTTSAAASGEMVPPAALAVASASVAASLRPASKKRGRTCKADGCDNYIVHKGLCCRHGGGKKCSVEGCDSSAKHGGRCWKHGGSVECKISECKKKAKAKGLCWAHGGGAKCQADACVKVAISNGYCWAHGGGKRCIFDGCQRPAFERTHSFCIRHFNELQHVDYYEV